MDSELLRPIRELAAEVADRKISPVELTEACLERVERLDDRLRAFITVTAERARKEARAAEQAVMRGEPLRPLHGIPVALKDLIDTEGIRTTSGSKLHADRIPAGDADVVRMLRAAGAVVLGKLNMYEFASGIPMPDDYFPAARNPWDLERTPGGSSSGSGAAVAAGMCLAALGTDTGGSIRGPAAFSGITGFKPTYDLVSRRGVVPLSWSLDHVGPMTRRVSDAAVVLEAMAGVSSRQSDGYTASLDGDIRGVRVGVPYSAIEEDENLLPEIRGAFDRALDVLRDLGAEVRAVELPRLVEQVSGMYAVIASSEALAYHQEMLANRSSDYGRGFRHRQGALYTAVDFVQAQRARTVLCSEMWRALSDVSVVAAPTTAATAPTLKSMAAGEKTPKSAVPTNIFNLTGGPSVSIPCGFTAGKLPIGIMLSASPGRDEAVLRAADAYERQTNWLTRMPPLADG